MFLVTKQFQVIFCVSRYFVVFLVSITFLILKMKDGGYVDVHTYVCLFTECTALIDTLCSLTTKLDEILDSLNNDEDFLACLFYCLYRLTEECSQDNFTASPSANSFTGYVPASWIQMKSAANRVFCRILELKRKVRNFS